MIKASQEPMRAEIKASQEVKAGLEEMKASPEEMEATVNSNLSKLEDMIKNWVEDGLFSVD
jgi:sensor domain CHASE-containing protein